LKESEIKFYSESKYFLDWGKLVGSMFLDFLIEDRDSKNISFLSCLGEHDDKKLENL
jgi:hypothetical protein